MPCEVILETVTLGSLISSCPLVLYVITEKHRPGTVPLESYFLGELKNSESTHVPSLMLTGRSFISQFGRAENL